MADNIITTTASTTTITSLEQVADKARGFAGQSMAENTKRTYRAAWASFTTWCRDHGLDALPATPSTIGLYLADASSSASVATLEVRLAAIRVAHRVAGHHLDLSQPAVRDVWRGIRRSLGTAQKKAAPVLTIDLCAMLAHLPDGLLGVRDRALLLVGFAACLRRSELVSLDVEDLTFHDNGGVLTVRRSKTDQEGRGRQVRVATGSSPKTCPVAALRAWLAAAAIVEGPVFRSVNRHGQAGDRLSGQAVALILKRHATAAGLDPATVSGHSLRRGHVTQAKRSHVDDHVVMAQGGWRSRAVFDGYDDVAGSDSSSAHLGL